MRAAIRSFLVAAIVSLVAAGASAAPMFSITEIPPQAADGITVAVGVNSAGQAAFYANMVSGDIHGFVWENGVVTDMGDLGGGSSYPMGINESGQTTGYSYNMSYQMRAFSWDSGTMTEVPTLGGYSGYGYGINGNGDVVGVSGLSSGYTHGFLWADGAITDLGTLGGTYSEAWGANSLRQVVGVATTATGDYQAFLWENGLMQGLPGLGGTYSVAYDINESGVAAGLAYDAIGYCHACLWENGVVTDMGVLPTGNTSIGWALNDAGWMVGYGDDMWVSHAMLWADGGIYDLNDLIPSGSGWELTDTRGISNRGHIVGVGQLDGQTRGYILTPNAVVPAPGAMLLGMLGVGLVAAVRKAGITNFQEVKR